MFLQNTPRSENRCSYNTHPGVKPYIPSKTQPGWETRYSYINPTEQAMKPGTAA